MVKFYFLFFLITLPLCSEAAQYWVRLTGYDQKSELTKDYRDIIETYGEYTIDGNNRVITIEIGPFESQEKVRDALKSLHEYVTPNAEIISKRSTAVSKNTGMNFINDSNTTLHIKRSGMPHQGLFICY